jgi:hypothetical protein
VNDGGNSCSTAACSGETCSDGIENQDETGVDCGGVCGACGSPPNFCPGGVQQFSSQSSCESGGTYDCSIYIALRNAGMWEICVDDSDPGCDNYYCRGDPWPTCEATGSSGLTEFDVGDSTILYNSLSGPGCNSKSRTCQSDGTWGGPFSSWVYTTCDEPVIETCTFLRPFGWHGGGAHCIEYFKAPGGSADELILSDGDTFHGAAGYCVGGGCYGDFQITCDNGVIVYGTQTCNLGMRP